MSRKTGLRAGGTLAVAAVVLALASAAIAAGALTPKLLSPNHKSVSAGKIRLVVDIPVKPLAHGVFIDISTRPKHNKAGRLNMCSVLHGCDFLEPKHWKGHKWSYVAPFNYSGYWSVTPGKYYWQVHYYTRGSVHYSAIGSFTVK